MPVKTILPEMQFLKDCCCIVKLVATAIDIVQGDKNCDLGCVMPTIKSLMTNVENVPTSVAVPLNNAILHVRMPDLISTSRTQTSY